MPAPFLYKEYRFIIRFSLLFVSASCCLERSANQEAGNPGPGGVVVGPGPGMGLAVIPDRPPLELDKLPPYHDVAPSAGEFLSIQILDKKEQQSLGKRNILEMCKRLVMRFFQDKTLVLLVDNFTGFKHFNIQRYTVSI